MPPEMKLRDRIVEMRRIPSREIMSHADNFRVHPQVQKNAMGGILKEIGIADVLVAYHSERNGGALTLIDGEMRKEDFPTDWPVVITDLNDEEADKLLQAMDPVGMMALVDRMQLEELQGRAQFQDRSVQVAIDAAAQFAAGLQPEEETPNFGMAMPEEEPKGIPDMELRPYEHYDYLMVVARSTMDWNWLTTRLQLETVNGTNDDRYPKIGLGRAITADRLIALIREGDEAKDQLRALKSKGGKAGTYADREGTF